MGKTQRSKTCPQFISYEKRSAIRKGTKNRCILLFEIENTKIRKNRFLISPQVVGRKDTLTGLREEGVEGIIATADGLVRGHLAIGLDAMLQAVEFPASVTFPEVGHQKQHNEQKKGARTNGVCFRQV